MFNKPGVAEAVLQTPLSLSNWVILFSQNLHFQTISRPYFERMFTTLKVSHVTCHMSSVICRASHVTFYFWLQSGWASWVVTIWVFEFCHKSFWVVSQFVFLSFVTIWIFEFCHNFSGVLSEFVFVSFVTICVFELNYTIDYRL